MKWNAFDFVSGSIDKTKERLLPFNFKNWLRLAVISALASPYNPSGNFNYNMPANNSEVPNPFSGMFLKIKENLGLIGIIVGVFSVLALIFSYIGSVFRFIWMESLLTKNNKFTFKKNSHNGFSFFLLSTLISIVMLVFLAVLAIPYLLQLNLGNSLLDVGIGYIVTSIILFFIGLFAISLLWLLMTDFVVPLMFLKQMTAFAALKEILKKSLHNKKEILVYILSRIVLNLGVAIICMMIFIISIIAVGIVAGVLFGLGYLLNRLVGLDLLFITLGIIFGVIFLIAYILFLLIVTLPLSTFGSYFSLYNFEKLIGLKAFGFKPKKHK